jgi:hypothetical protein
MAVPFATSVKSTTNALSATTATAVPSSMLAGRSMLKIVNTDPTNTVWYGDSSVTDSTGIPIGPGGESDWIPAGVAVYCYCKIALTVVTLEGT